MAGFEYPEHIQARLDNCGTFIPYKSPDGMITGHFKNDCNLNVCPTCHPYRVEKAMDMHYYPQFKECTMYKFTQKYPKAQTKIDIDNIYLELENTELLFKNLIGIECAEIFMAHDLNHDEIVTFFTLKTEILAGQKNDFVPMLPVFLQKKLMKLGSVKHVKNYAKELKKEMWKHKRLTDDKELNAYILKRGDDKEEGKAFKKRTRKINLRGKKLNNDNPHRKVPAVRHNGSYHAVIKQKDMVNTKTKEQILYLEAKNVFYNVQDNGTWTSINLDEFMQGKNEGKYLWEWEQYFPQTILKKSVRCKDCKKNIKDMKDAGIFDDWKNKFREDYPHIPICEQIGVPCDFCVRHRNSAN